MFPVILRCEWRSREPRRRRPERRGRILRGPHRVPIALRDGCPSRPPQDDGSWMHDLVLATRLRILVIARSASDEAIQSGASAWIASRHFVPLAMTSRSRDAFRHPSSATSNENFPQRRERSAERRIQPWPHRRMRQRPVRRPLAFRRSTAALAKAVTPRLNSGPRFLELPGANGRTLPGASAASTSRTSRNAGQYDARSRPGAVC